MQSGWWSRGCSCCSAVRGFLMVRELTRADWTLRCRSRAGSPVMVPPTRARAELEARASGGANAGRGSLAGEKPLLGRAGDGAPRAAQQTIGRSRATRSVARERIPATSSRRKYACWPWASSPTRPPARHAGDDPAAQRGRGQKLVALIRAVLGSAMIRGPERAGAFRKKQDS